MQDRHVGRETPVFVIEGHPDKFIGLIQRHGVLSRIMRARRCPCATSTGSPDIYCDLCMGDGMIYDFQRKMLQADEDSDIGVDSSVVYPFRIPVIEPVRVERLLAPEQGGIKEYTIDEYTASEIRISGNPLPRKYEKMRVTYYFDRFEYVQDELVTVDAATRILTTKGTAFDGGHRSSNFFNVHGDIAVVEKVYDTEKSHTYTNYTFRKNKIYVDPGEPAPTPDKVQVSYYYVPPARVLTSDIEVRQLKQEKWTSELPEGECRMAMEPWFELGEGDIITLLTPTLYKNEIIKHSGVIDKLIEFDVARIDEIIFDEDGKRYEVNIDFVLKGFRDISWIGNQPVPGKRISVRYGYHPTYVVFQDHPMPNTLENKQYPQVVRAKIWAKTLSKDIETMKPLDSDFGYAS